MTHSCFLLGNSITAEGFSLALGTSVPLPDAIDMVGSGIYQRRFVGEDTGLEVAVIVAFHTHTGTCEVGRTDVGGSAVENHYLEMYSWTKPPL